MKCYKNRHSDSNKKEKSRLLFVCLFVRTTTERVSFFFLLRGSVHKRKQTRTALFLLCKANALCWMGAPMKIWSCLTHFEPRIGNTVGQCTIRVPIFVCVFDQSFFLIVACRTNQFKECWFSVRFLFYSLFIESHYKLNWERLCLFLDKKYRFFFSSSSLFTTYSLQWVRLTIWFSSHFCFGQTFLFM